MIKKNKIKKLLILSMIFLSGCCAFTSKDCGCVPPDPELNAETLKWIAPYDNQDYFVFEDSLGNKDSLQVVRESDTEFCGGDECGSDCQVEMAILTSLKNPNLKFTITATQIKDLRINNQEENETRIFVEFNVLNDATFSSNENTSVLINTDFEWNNEKIKVLQAKCKGSLICSDYEMKEMVVSRKFGLIEYITKDEIRWKKIN